MIDIAKASQYIDQCWGDEIVPALIEYIKIPNKSPAFDPDWAAHGYMDEAVALFERWARARLPLAARRHARGGAAARPHAGDPDRGAGRRAADTVLLYGHLDKQPEMVGWAEGYGPWMPRLEGDKLYGRGGADDGYAMFGALTALCGAAGAGRAACALRDPDRGLRGIGQLRPAVLCRSSGRPHRQPVAGGLPRFRAAATTTSYG